MSFTPLSIYLIAINIFTFLVRGLDKIKAGQNLRRISEKQLLLLCGLGGVFGAMVGMKTFRHKTIKPTFTPKVRLIALIWAGILMYIQSFT